MKLLQPPLVSHPVTLASGQKHTWHFKAGSGTELVVSSSVGLKVSIVRDEAAPVVAFVLPNDTLVVALDPNAIYEVEVMNRDISNAADVYVAVTG